MNADTLGRWVAGVEHYQDFCTLNALRGWRGEPAYPTARRLAEFAVWLTDFRSVAPKSITQHVLGVARWAMVLETARGDPRLGRNGRMDFVLYSTLRGIKRIHARRRQPREALTVDKLNVLLTYLEKLPHGSMSEHDKALFAALLTLGVYGLTRCGEIVSPSTIRMSETSARLGDVRVFRTAHGALSYYEFTIKGSKMDVFRAGTIIRV